MRGKRAKQIQRAALAIWATLPASAKLRRSRYDNPFGRLYRGMKRAWTRKQAQS